MLFVLTLFAFCAAAAYISAPFWSRRSTPLVITAPVSPPGSELRRRVEAEAEIEILVARRRRRIRVVQASQNVAAQQNAAVHVWQCAECGRQMGRDDRFCASCGAARPA